MPSNNSATGGYLAPAGSPAPLEDDAFENFLHDVFAGITGLDNGLVRPRWQQNPPNQPDINENWLAFGITNQEGDTYGAIQHDPAGDGADEFQRHETVEILLSAYGPGASGVMSALRDGLLIEQNRAALTAAGMGVQQTGGIRPAPVLVKERWVKRVDMPLTIRRQIQRVYPVLSLLSARMVLDNEKYLTDITVTGP